MNFRFHICSIILNLSDCDRTCEFFHDGASTSLNLVVDSYYHAITTNFPRYRYYVGIDSIYLLLLLLPTYIQDFVTCDVFSFVTGWPPKVTTSGFNLVKSYTMLKDTAIDWCTRRSAKKMEQSRFST